MALTGMWSCDDIGLYYVRELPDGEVFWFGHRARRFANVFRGRRVGNRINGQFLDVPYGRTVGGGDLRLRVETGDGAFVREEGSEFGGSHWTVFRRGWFAPGPGERFGGGPAQFQGSGIANLSGTWTSDTDAVYWVRDDPATRRFAWFGQRTDGTFANVFFGTRAGSTIRGRWSDIPGRGRQSNQGQIDDMTVDRDVDPSGALALGATMSRSLGSSRRVYWRYESTTVEVDFRELAVLDTNEAGGDEPYVWLFVVKVDADSISLLNAPSLPPAAAFRPSVLTSRGDQNNLGGHEDVGAGTVLHIPADVGHFQARMRTVRGLLPRTPASDALTRLFVIGLAWDEDGSVESAVEAAYRQAGLSIAEHGQRILRREVRRVQLETLAAVASGQAPSISFDTNALVNELLGLVREDAEDAGVSAGGIGGAISGFLGSPDDLLGSSVKNMSFSELTASAATTKTEIPFTFVLTYPPPGVLIGTSPIRDDTSRYELRGSVTVWPSGRRI